MEFLNNINPHHFILFVYGWGAISIFSSLAIYLTKTMPISGRIENNYSSWLGSMDKKWGWIIMETPILITVVYFYCMGNLAVNASIVLLGAFIFHYIHRALIYPYRIKAQGKTIAVSMVIITMVFYTINGYIIGHYFGSLRVYPIAWLMDPRFIIGLLLFAFGFIVNVHSDNILFNLRKPGESGYKIPQGGFYRWVSCPNYSGEIIEWTGFAIMAWSLPTTIYSLWVILALIPQGLIAHQWYLQKFPLDYPKERKALLPYLI